MKWILIFLITSGCFINCFAQSKTKVNPVEVVDSNNMNRLFLELNDQLDSKNKIIKEYEEVVKKTNEDATFYLTWGAVILSLFTVCFLFIGSFQFIFFRNEFKKMKSALDENKNLMNKQVEEKFNKLDEWKQNYTKETESQKKEQESTISANRDFVNNSEAKIKKFIASFKKLEKIVIKNRVVFNNLYTDLLAIPNYINILLLKNNFKTDYFEKEVYPLIDHHSVILGLYDELLINVFQSLQTLNSENFKLQHDYRSHLDFVKFSIEKKVYKDLDRFDLSEIETLIKMLEYKINILRLNNTL